MPSHNLEFISTNKAEEQTTEIRPSASSGPRSRAPDAADANARSVTLDALRRVQLNWRFRVGESAFVGIVIALLLQLSQHKNVLHWITTVATVLTSLGAAATEWARRGQEAKSWHVGVVGTLFTLTALCGMAYLGVLSLVGAILVALVTGFGMGSMERPAWAVYLTSAIGFAVLVILALVGVLPLTGSVLALTRENPRALIGLTIMLELILWFTFAVGRQSRATISEAIARVDSAQQELNRRGVLLEEARAELGRFDRPNSGMFTGRDIGPYTAQEVIGRGGVADVYRAVDNRSGGLVALKLLHPNSLEDKTSVERFVREAQVSSELASEHIVKVLDSGSSADKIPYLAMELLDGSDLGRILRKQNRLSVAETVELVTQLTQALDLAEKAGIVHRDIKPQNVFRTIRAGHVHWKLLDFGASKLRATHATLTRGAAIGTPGYMSPEQVRGESVDHRSDVFSLGAISYRALTGQPPFAGPDPMAIMYKVDTEQPIRPSALAPLRAEIDAVLGLALAKDRKRRLATAREFASALVVAANGKLANDMWTRAIQIQTDWPWRTLSGPIRTEASSTNPAV